MKILNAFRDGMRRAAAAPAVLFGVFALTFLVALPLGLVLRGHDRRTASAESVAARRWRRRA